MRRESTNSSRARARPALVPAVRRPAKLLALLGLPTVIVPALVLAGDTGPSRLDTSIQKVVADNEPAGTWGLIRGLDWLGEPVGRGLLMLAIALVCLVAGRRALAATAVLGIVTISLLATALKPLVDRRIHDDFLSYPSGHTAALAAAAMIVGLLLADLLYLGPVAGTAVMVGLTVATGLLTAWAQVILTAHYPTDTLGGFGLAVFVVPATAVLIDRFAARRAANRPASK